MSQVLIDTLKALPTIVLCFIVWRHFMRQRDIQRSLLNAQYEYNRGKLGRGNVWIHLKTGRPYTVLWLTNTGTSKAGWEVNVVYTNDFKQVYSRPFSEFCDKFCHISAGSTEQHFEILKTTMRFENNTELRVPQAGEIWFEGTVHAVPQELVEQGHAPQVVSQRRAHIDMVLGLGEAHPVVVYTVNEKQTAMLLSQFIFIYSKEVSFDGTISSSV